MDSPPFLSEGQPTWTCNAGLSPPTVRRSNMASASSPSFQQLIDILRPSRRFSSARQGQGAGANKEKHAWPRLQRNEIHARTWLVPASNILTGHEPVHEEEQSLLKELQGLVGLSPYIVNSHIQSLETSLYPVTYLGGLERGTVKAVSTPNPYLLVLIWLYVPE